ncbi:heat shock 70 kDa protein 12A-like [Mya arenaria]|uniref:heat shock 70 kDa protein 12A-like n=1 Tax=Mya arenaria TaxID=6604 RepID=UPI0022E7667E|nr:heat shock 70 kDa protein 12A-like [Mya arenaria]
MGASNSVKHKKERWRQDSSLSIEKNTGTEGVKQSDELAVVVAIDFGTSYTGYAFSLKGSRDVINLQTHGGKLPADRVPSAMLLNPDETFNSFGYDAMDKYSCLSREARRVYFYFEHFKLLLYRTIHGKPRDNEYTLHLRAMNELGLRDGTKLDELSYDQMPKDLRKYWDSMDKRTHQSNLFNFVDRYGKQINAQKVFSLAIKYFRDLALDTVKMTTQGCKEEYIQWMISIPAIWSDSARQFMRQAAVDAGIRSENLRLVLEPEAASLYCEEHAAVASGNTLGLFTPGQKYILADLGGGTADICIHEIVGDGRLRELYRATGGHLGGNTVNEEFEKFMSGIVGDDVWNDFKKLFIGSYFDMMTHFESKKHEFRTQTKQVQLTLEHSLIELCEKRSNTTFHSIVSNCKHRDGIEYNSTLGKLLINRLVMEGFFEFSLDGITHTFRTILQSCETDNLVTVLLVGGYAESQFVREKIKTAFPNLSVMLPSDSRLAVLKGAVMMGYKPRDIVERRARYTYGFGCNDVFKPGGHPLKLKYISEDGKEKCVGVFNRMIKMNQVVVCGDTFHWIGFSTAVHQNQRLANKCIALWRSSNPGPLYCLDKEGSDLLRIEDQECEKVGDIVMKPPREGWQQYSDCDAQLIVGETELIVKYINKNTGQVYETNMNFF